MKNKNIYFIILIFFINHYTHAFPPRPKPPNERHINYRNDVYTTEAFNEYLLKHNIITSLEEINPIPKKYNQDAKEEFKKNFELENTYDIKRKIYNADITTTKEFKKGETLGILAGVFLTEYLSSHQTPTQTHILFGENKINHHISQQDACTLKRRGSMLDNDFWVDPYIPYLYATQGDNNYKIALYPKNNDIHPLNLVKSPNYSRETPNLKHQLKKVKSTQNPVLCLVATVGIPAYTILRVEPYSSQNGLNIQDSYPHAEFPTKKEIKAQQDNIYSHLNNLKNYYNNPETQKQFTNKPDNHFFDKFTKIDLIKCF